MFPSNKHRGWANLKNDFLQKVHKRTLKAIPQNLQKQKTAISLAHRHNFLFIILPGLQNICKQS